MRTLVFPIAAAFLLFSCGPKHGRGGGHVAGADFPKAEELARIADAPLPAVTPPNIADVDSWKLVGPLRDRVDRASHEARTPWELLAQASGVAQTESMYCIARELGTFDLAHEGDPPEDLVQFVAARCGADLDDVDREGITFDVNDDVTEDSLVSQARDEVLTMLARWKRPRAEVGIWFGRQKGHAVVLVVGGQPEAEIEPLPLVPGADGKVRIRGTVSYPVSRVGGVINQGRFGFEECIPSIEVVLPQFELVCTNASDDAAWVEVDVLEEGHLLGHSLFETLVFPKKKPADVYRRPAISAGKPGETDLTRAFLGGLNEVRDAAHLAPVEEVKGESALATRLAPYYFGFLRGNALMSEKIALGLMAGWSVEVPIRYGKLTSGWTNETRDPRRVLASYLEHPDGRAVLLDPDVSLLGLGLVPVPGKSVIGTVVVSWSAQGVETQDSRIARALAHIAALRAEKNLPAGHRVTGAGDTDAAVARIEESHGAPEKALRELMRDAAERSRHGVRGIVIETSSLDDFTLPEGLATTPNLDLVMGIAWTRPAGQPWGHYYILIVFPEAVKV